MQNFPLRRLFVTLFTLGICLTQASFAVDGESTVIVPPGTDSHFISYGASTLVAYEPPKHGILMVDNNGFQYIPYASFWAMGYDMMLMEVTLPSGINHTYRYVLAAGSLAQDGSNIVYATTATGPGDWTTNALVVPGTVDPNAYLLDVDSNDPQPGNLTAGGDDTTGHQQTSEHVVNVTVDDLDLRSFPNLDPANEISFYRLMQGSDVIVELLAHFDFARSTWQIKAHSEEATTMDYIDVTEGFYQVKLVRWGIPGKSGADLYINGQYMDAIQDLPFLLSDSATYEISLDPSPAHDGMQMRFEDPVVTVGTSYDEPFNRLATDSFGGSLSGTPQVSSDWDVVEGAAHLSFSPQTLAGFGHQVDIDLGAVPHWEHAYLRQDYQSAPLSNYKMRFWMDNSQLNLLDGHAMRMVYACRNSAANWCVDFRMVLTRTAGQLELNLDVWEEGAMHTITAPISNGAHWVELQYETSPSTNVATGWVELRIDGVSVGTVRGLDNHNFTIEDVRIGSNYTSSTVTGFLSLDEILTWTR